MLDHMLAQEDRKTALATNPIEALVCGTDPPLMFGRCLELKHSPGRFVNGSIPIDSQIRMAATSGSSLCCTSQKSQELDPNEGQRSLPPSAQPATSPERIAGGEEDGEWKRQLAKRASSRGVRGGT